MVANKTYNVGIYVRLSKDDERNGESVSIENQKLLLTKYVAEQPDWSLYETYADDGWSGTNFERPAFRRMLADAKDGTINLIIVKDLSRFGRNYIEVGQFTDYIFPAIGCRFVALNDNVDTIHNENDIMAYKNLFNEFHSRDTSKKVRTIRKARAEAGKFMGSKAPYGYKKDPECKHKLIIDEQTAPVVRNIFEMRCAGMGYHAIACALNNEQIPPPRETHYKEKGTVNPIKGNGLWSNSVVMRLMRNEAYIGNMVQLKMGTLSYKNRKLVNKPKEEWVRVENTHEPLIDIAVWNRAHEINAKKHKPRKIVSGNTNIFVGLLVCADCGTFMRYQSRKKLRKDGSYWASANYLCGNYSRSGKTACSAHVVKEQAIHEMVIDDIRRNARLVLVDEKRVVKEITIQKNTELANSLAFFEKEAKKTASRVSELEKCIRSLYEDKIKGIIPESAFMTLIERYENERLDKMDSLESLRSKIAVVESESNDVSVWANTIKKYTAIEKLDSAVLHELINKIVIGHSVIVGERFCDITIYYRFAGRVDLSIPKQEAGYGKAV